MSSPSDLLHLLTDPSNFLQTWFEILSIYTLTELLTDFQTMAPRKSRPARAPTQQAHVEASDNGEDFNLNVSGSDSDKELRQHQPAGRRTTSNVPTEPVDQQINNLAIREKKTTAHDIKFFFEPHDDANVACSQCR